MDKTKIEWTDATWNPVRGCTKVSAGCDNCYAMSVAHRFSGPGQAYEGLTRVIGGRGQWNGQVRLVPNVLSQPLRWQRPRRIFVNSMSDLFHEGVPDSFIDDVFAVMGAAQRHTFQVLTKRPRRMLEYLTGQSEYLDEARIDAIRGAAFMYGYTGDPDSIHWPLPNVWLGVSAENQAAADERVPLLLDVPAAVRFLSCEPLLGSLNLSRWLELGALDTDLGLSNPGIDWVIAGGESGPQARPMHPAWARSLRDQCNAAKVSFFFKQWGDWIPMMGHAEGVQVHGPKFTHPDGTIMGRAGKKAAGRLLDGRTHDEFPEVS